MLPVQVSTVPPALNPGAHAHVPPLHTLSFTVFEQSPSTEHAVPVYNKDAYVNYNEVNAQ